MTLHLQVVRNVEQEHVVGEGVCELIVTGEAEAAAAAPGH